MNKDPKYTHRREKRKEVCVCRHETCVGQGQGTVPDEGRILRHGYGRRGGERGPEEAEAREDRREGGEEQRPAQHGLVHSCRNGQGAAGRGGKDRVGGMSEGMEEEGDDGVLLLPRHHVALLVLDAERRRGVGVQQGQGGSEAGQLGYGVRLRFRMPPYYRMHDGS